MNMRNIMSMVCLMVMMVVPSYGKENIGNSDAGQAGAFLEQGIGARPMSMGEAFVGVADDANAVFWNQAGLLQLKKRELTAMYSDPYQNFSDVSYHSITYAQPLLERFAVGISGVLSSVGNIPGYDVNNLQQSNFSVNDWAILAAAGYRYSTQLTVGGAIKYVNTQVNGQSDGGLGLDVSLMYQPLEAFRMGLQLQNAIEPNIKIQSVTGKVPRTFRFGASYKVIPQLLLSVGLDKASNRDVSINTGGELEFYNRFFLRGGYTTGKSAWSVGGGVNFDYIQLDYVFNPNKELGDSHRFSLGTRF